jgi:hypothetical protein
MFSSACFQQRFTRRDCAKLLIVLGAQAVSFSKPKLATDQMAALTGSIPQRASQAPTGSQFAEYVSKMDSQQREQAILSQLFEGNLPGFLRALVPVKLNYEQASGKTLAATIFVMPEYLAIGSNSDFLRIPMNFHTAIAIADRFGFVLPTRKIVDAIYDQSSYHYVPQPLPAGPQMRSTEYYRIHNAMIDKQSRALGIPLGALVSGHKKDVVLTSRLASRPDQIAIYGWHRGPGAPIQPLSTVHGARYADYSHGIRLVSEMAMVDGRTRSVYDILEDSLLANVLSDEGRLRNLSGLKPTSLATSAVSSSLEGKRVAN